MKLAGYVALLASFAGVAFAHTSLVTPASREGGKETFGDEKNTIGCPKPGNGPVTEVRAGQDTPVAYWRNNHIGGFVRWAIIKKGEPETKENFDKNVFFYTCREVGSECYPRNGKGYSLYKEANDGTDVFTISCGATIKIPEYLDDGDYVLQFTNFGTGHSFGNAGLATPTYRSCADLRVKGGSSQKPRPKCPTFVGGDRATWNEKNRATDQCAYFYSNDIPDHVFEEKDQSKLDSLYKFGKPGEIERCNGQQGGSAPTRGPANATESFTFEQLADEP